MVSERELNQNLVKGIKFEDYVPEVKKSIKFGDAGSNWRMMKLKRAKEQAEDEGRPLMEVGVEKYGVSSFIFIFCVSHDLLNIM